MSHIMTKKFSDDEIDEVLSKIEKFADDGIQFIHLKDAVKKNFVKNSSIVFISTSYTKRSKYSGPLPSSLSSAALIPLSSITLTMRRL